MLCDTHLCDQEILQPPDRVKAGLILILTLAGVICRNRCTHRRINIFLADAGRQSCHLQEIPQRTVRARDPQVNTEPVQFCIQVLQHLRCHRIKMCNPFGKRGRYFRGYFLNIQGYSVSERDSVWFSARRDM